MRAAALLAAMLLLALPVSAQVGPAPEDEAPVPAAPDPVEPAFTAEEREAVFVMLTAYHALPNAATFEAAARAPQAALWSITRDETVSPLFRDRALAALTYWPTPELRAHLESLLRSPDTREMVVHRALGQLATAFGDDAVGVIVPFLGVDDVQLRLTAVHALREIGSVRAAAALDEAALHERHPVVLEQLERLR